MKRRTLLTAGAALIGAPALVSAQGAAWPTKGPIRLVAQFPPGGLVDVVSRVMLDLQGLAEARQVQLRVDRPFSAPVYARAEELLCYSILANLLKNAVEATPTGGANPISISTPVAVQRNHSGRSCQVTNVTMMAMPSMLAAIVTTSRTLLFFMVVSLRHAHARNAQTPPDHRFRRWGTVLDVRVSQVGDGS